MDHALRSLRRGIGRIDRKRGRGRWYPTALRRRIAAWTRRRRDGGASWREIADDVGVSAESLRRWASTEIVVAPAPALVPIEVVADTSEYERGVRLITAAGHRIEGLTISDVIAVVRVLG
jgi:hypothetical protein